ARDGAALDRFIAAAVIALAPVAPGIMLTPGIHRAYQQGVDRVGRSTGVSLLARGADSDAAHGGRAALYATSAGALISNAEIGAEIFGPASMVVRCADEAEVLRVLEHLEGQLSITLP